MTVSEAVEQLLGVRPARVEPMRGGASTRAYHRVRFDLGAFHVPTIVVMELRGDPFASEEATAGGVPKELPFLEMQRFLASRGLPVPEVYAADVEAGFVLIEDLGDETVARALSAGAPPEPLYEAAVDLLVDFQVRSATPDSSCVASGRAFDAPLLRWELDHFLEWGLAARAVVLGETDRVVLDRAFGRIVGELAAAPRVLVHRDFQSTNLLVKDGRLRLIDFQDAMMGSRVYDLAALLCDSYVDLGEPLSDRLFERYARASAILDKAALRRLFDLQTVQRKLKDAGRFVYIDRIKHNPAFLPFFEPSLAYVTRALGRLPDLGDLADVLGRLR